ncbi:hypothetical protein FACS1894113_4260 [Alphaproteobacteria bacterium]|nr:hypothetical protein FACS1894113_4260 [Alphaproteobacteria bacterium]
MKGWEDEWCSMYEHKNYDDVKKVQKSLMQWKSKRFYFYFDKLRDAIARCSLKQTYGKKINKFECLKIYNMINGHFEMMHKLIQSSDYLNSAEGEDVIRNGSSSFATLVYKLYDDRILPNKLLLSRFLHGVASELFVNYGIFDRDLFALATESLDYYINIRDLRLHSYGGLHC